MVVGTQLVWFYAGYMAVVIGTVTLGKCAHSQSQLYAGRAEAGQDAGDVWASLRAGLPGFRDG